jgi:mannose-1-phosphate guanylyltransferase
VLAAQAHEAPFRRALRGLIPTQNLIVEPLARGIAVAIAYGAAASTRRLGDGVIASVAADHHIVTGELAVGYGGRRQRQRDSRQRDLTRVRALLAHSDTRLMVLFGVRDLIVVDTGDAILIAHRERSPHVGRVTEELKRRRLERYL